MRILAAWIPAALLAAGAAHADPLDDLRAAVASFRGVGYAEVAAYSAAFRLPEEDPEEAVRLEELWRAPGDFAVRAAERAAPAVVRSYAIFLEPLYVARSAILDTDLDQGMQRIREIGSIAAVPASGGARTIRITLPASKDAQLPGFLRDVTSIEAALDARGRLSRLRLEFPAGASRRAADSLEVTCEWGDARARQPSRCLWRLPDGGEVRVETTFRDEGKRRVPAIRHVVFPSRYDPGETEEIRIEYEKYRWDAPAASFAAAGTFRYGPEGLRTD